MDVLMRVNSYRQASREFRDTLYHSGERLMDMVLGHGWRIRVCIMRAGLTTPFPLQPNK